MDTNLKKEITERLEAESKRLQREIDSTNDLLEEIQKIMGVKNNE